MKRLSILFLLLAIAYTGAGLLPGRVFAPVDLLRDFDAWKSDPAERVRVSNSLMSDVVVQFIPWDTEIVRLLQSGELPWVNRYAGEGGPLFANPQTALFSPFTWPRLAFGLRGWVVFALLKLLAAAFCSFWMARELDVPRRQAAVSAAVFTTAGYTVVWLLWPHTSVFVLLPGLAAAALRLMKEPRRRNALLTIAFGALCTAGGHPETLFVGVIGIWVFLLWEADRRRDLGLRSVVPPSVGALLGFALLSIQLVPFFAVLSDSHAGAARPDLAHWFRGWAVVSEILPGILGSPLRGELDLTALASTESFHFRASGFIGAIVVFAILAAWRSLTPTLQRGMLIGAAALLLSWYPPGIWPLFRHAPVLRVLALEYGVVLFVLFGSMAAGPALAIVASRQRRSAAILAIVAGSALLVAGILPAVPAARPALTRIARGGIEELRARGQLRQAAAVYERRLDGYLRSAGTTALRRAALPGALWMLAGVTLLLPVARRELLLSSLAIGELLAFGIGFNPAVRDALPSEPPAIAVIRQLDPAGESLLAAHFEVFPANAGTLYRVRDVVSYDVLESESRVAALTEGGYDSLAHTVNPILTPDQTHALARLGVRWVLSRSDVADARRIAGPPAPNVGVYELRGVIPAPPPANLVPSGFWVGLALSLIAAGVALAWLKLFTLAPPVVAAGFRPET